MRLAEIHLASKNLDAARKSLKQALSVSPDLLAAQKALIELELTEKRPQEALVIARTVQKQRPLEPIGFFMEGAAETARQNHTASVDVYRSALGKFGSSEAAIKLYSSLTMAKRESEAEKLAVSWLQSHPKDANFLAYMGDVALFNRNYSASESYFKRVLELQPNNAMAFNNIAWMMATLDKRGAVELAQKATALLPNTPAFLDTLAMALDMENQTQKAIDVQKKAVSLAPYRPAFRLRLAKLYIKAGDKATARSELTVLAKLKEKFNAQPEVSKLLKSL